MPKRKRKSASRVLVPKKKKYNKKNYTIHSVNTTQGKANKRASNLRKGGMNARTHKFAKPREYGTNKGRFVVYAKGK